MWQIYALLARDIIRDRQQEAEATRMERASRWDPAWGPAPAAASARMGLVRRASAGALRRVETAAARLATAACAAATRLEGRVA